MNNRCSRQLSVAAVALTLGLAACGGAGGHAVPQAVPQNASVRLDSRAATCPCFAVRYSFGSTPTDARKPEEWNGTLVLLNGVLYGVSITGGNFRQGTVFSVTSAGNEQVLYSFGRTSNDGKEPSALTESNGLLYGVTFFGGTHKAGTFFSLTTSGAETVLHNFANDGFDANSPTTALTPVNGVIYSTTNSGGLHNLGTIYSVTPSGAENVLYSFAGGVDGNFPSSLTDVNGILYGTTPNGGTKGQGTLFRFNPTSKKKTVIYNFGSADGDQPNQLTYHNGVLYGTTVKGGDLSAVSGGAGTIFSVTQSGVEKVLHDFKGPDGAFPYAKLVELRGVLYGATSGGGSKAGGVLFGFNPTTQAFSVFHNGTAKFTGLASNMVVLNDKLWGTTPHGGKNDDGALFDLTP